jgi:hypothetical protein
MIPTSCCCCGGGVNLREEFKTGWDTVVTTSANLGASRINWSCVTKTETAGRPPWRTNESTSPIDVSAPDDVRANDSSGQTRIVSLSNVQLPLEPLWQGDSTSTVYAHSERQGF